MEFLLQQSSPVQRTHTGVHRFSLSPPSNWSEVDLSSVFPRPFLREDFPGSQSREWQETTVRNEGEGRAAERPPDSLQQKVLLDKSILEQKIVIFRPPVRRRHLLRGRNSATLLKEVRFWRKPDRSHPEIVTSGLH